MVRLFEQEADLDDAADTGEHKRADERRSAGRATFANVRLDILAEAAMYLAKS